MRACECVPANSSGLGRSLISHKERRGHRCRADLDCGQPHHPSESRAITAAHAAASQDARRRLDRLEAFLAQDPHNQRLLADAFEVALRAREWERAGVHLEQGAAAAPMDPAWTLRRADLLLATGDHGSARVLLEAMAETEPAPAGLLATVAHNLSYIDFAGGDHPNAVLRLEPWMNGEQELPPEAAPAFQQLWLRALHRLRDTARACEWALDAERTGSLHPLAAGVAALAAIDFGDLDAARRWVARALAEGVEPTAEALVSRATLALAEQDAASALAFTDQALSSNPTDGRAWSTRGYAHLLATDFNAAAADFSNALEAMPEHVGTWHGQGWNELLRGNVAAAQEAFESAVDLDRNFAESHGALAVVSALRGDRDQARRQIQVANRLQQGTLSTAYAEAILSGRVHDRAGMQRLARHLLSARARAAAPPRQ